jgi:hypothetical protein
VHEVHGPNLIAAHRRLPVIPELRLHATLWRFVPYLQAHLAIQTVHALLVDEPAVTPKQNVDTPVAVAYPRFRDLFDPLLQFGLVAATALVVIARSFIFQHRAGAPGAHSPAAA